MGPDSILNGRASPVLNAVAVSLKAHSGQTGILGYPGTDGCQNHLPPALADRVLQLNPFLDRRDLATIIHALVTFQAQ